MLVVAGALLALPACGSDGASAGEGNVLVAAIGTNPPHFNRNLTTEIGTSVVGATMLEALVRLDADYTPVPALAESWEANKDATQFEFKLRDGVTWHDGEAFTSEDVKFTFDNFVALNPTATFAKDVESVETPDDLTVVVTLDKPFAAFVEALTSVWIVPEHIYNDGQDLTSHPANLEPVGTGPYKFEEFVSGDRVSVVRFDDYWGEQPDAERIVFKVIPDANSRILALQSGEVDYMYGNYIDIASYEKLDEDPNLEFLPMTGGVSTVTTHVNTNNKILSDANVRKALYQAFDREALVEKAYYGYATPARGAIPADFTWAVSDDIDFQKLLPYDVEEAKRLLDEAGYPEDADGNRFKLTLAYPAEYPSMAAVGGVMKSDFADIGVELDLVGEDFAVWTERTYTKNDFDLSIVFYTSYEDPSIGVARVYVCNPDKAAFRNASGMCDEQIDAAFAEASATTDREARAAAFAEAETRIAEEMFNWPVAVEETYSMARKDRWNFTEANSLYSLDWSLVRRAD
jgi:peptide/nickel transport system substrate-binding protein